MVAFSMVLVFGGGKEIGGGLRVDREAGSPCWGEGKDYGVL